MDLVENLKKPTKSEREALSKLFPSTSGKRSATQFDPTAECCVSKQKRMKKAATTPGRPCKVEVLLLPEVYDVVPKGKKKKQLTAEGRIKTLTFRRSMNAIEVRNVIMRGFVEFQLREWVYFTTSQNNRLEVSQDQFVGKDVVDRKGRLYICEKVINNKALCDNCDKFNF